MAYIPPIKNYRPFYIQTSSDVSAIDTTMWGLVAKTNPYNALPEPKETYTNDFKDEHGDDDFTDKIFYKPLEFSVSFYVKCFDTEGKSAQRLLHEQIDAFFAKIKEGEFKIYDSYTGLGRQDVRYVGYESEEFKARDNWAKHVFQVHFKANDPITRIVLSDGVLIPE